jgi:hypothetical protein
MAFKKGYTPWNKGKKHSKEHIEKVRQCHLGKKRKPFSKIWKKRIGEAGKKRKGILAGGYKGGIKHLSNGYIFILSHDHPNKTKEGYVLEHRLVMEKKIGRILKKKEVVHHINEIRNDNRPENLMLFNNLTEHINYHRIFLNKKKSKPT